MSVDRDADGEGLLGLRVQTDGAVRGVSAGAWAATVYSGLFAIGLAILIVYMLLASQFNSFVQPLVVMTAQPLAVVGGRIEKSSAQEILFFSDETGAMVLSLAQNSKIFDFPSPALRPIKVLRGGVGAPPITCPTYA